MAPTPKLDLTVLAGSFTVHRFAADSQIPDAVFTSAFYNISRTAAELSIVCDSTLKLESLKAETGWSCIAIAGPLDFSLTGILAALATPLAAAQVSILAVSTFDTDHLLVKTDKLPLARQVLQAAGHTFGGRAGMVSV